MAELILPTSARGHARERGARAPLSPASLQASFLEAMAEFAAEGRGVRGSMLGDYLLDEAPAWESPEGFAAYVARVRAESLRPRDPGFVPHTTWWWVEGTSSSGASTCATA